MKKIIVVRKHIKKLGGPTCSHQKKINSNVK